MITSITFHCRTRCGVKQTVETIVNTVSTSHILLRLRWAGTGVEARVVDLRLLLLYIRKYVFG